MTTKGTPPNPPNAPANRSGEMPTSKRSHRPPSSGSSSSEAESTETFTLLVVEGPDAGKSFAIDASSPSRVLVGQSPLCNFVLSDREVSRRHLSIRATGDGLDVMDLESTNGTTVNGVTIKEAVLNGGETLRLGASIISAARGEPAIVALTRASSFGRLLGESRAMRKLYPVLDRLAKDDAKSNAGSWLLIEGEAGTGKELCAEELHTQSSRKDGPFLTLETASLDASEIDDRLFGNDGGEGLIDQARHGTLVIDDASDLPASTQSRLVALPALFDTSIVFTTSRDLDRAATEGRFRPDLLERLASSIARLPPLRDREGDIQLLARAFWGEIAAPPAGSQSHAATAELPADFLPRFESYPWPGNVRELRGAVEARMRSGELGLGNWRSEQAVRTEGDFIGAVVAQDGITFARAKQAVMNELERRYVEEVVTRHGGSIQRAAAASGLAMRYFQLLRARHKK